MLRLVLTRLLAALPNLAGVVVITFVLTRALPGDPAAYFAGAAATQEAVAQVRTQLGLDRPLVAQFFSYLGALAQGDLGLSISTGQPVLTELLLRLPASLELVLLALVLACAVALPLGVLAATRPGSWVDQLCRVLTTAGVSLPTFFTGLLLSYVFYFLLGWAPSPLGRLDPMFSPPPTVSGLYLVDAALAGDAALWWACCKQLVLPVVTMALFVLAPIARMTRASMLAVLSADFVRTLGMVFGFMLGSSVIVEKVFGWPGVGSYAIDALTASDYAPVQGFVLAMGILFVLLNLLVDVLYGLIDPRVEVSA
jgi:ABC-type dipeptide/oligopeptide/nickel transport system permease component